MIIGATAFETVLRGGDIFRFHTGELEFKDGRECQPKDEDGQEKSNVCADKDMLQRCYSRSNTVCVVSNACNRLQMPWS